MRAMALTAEMVAKVQRTEIDEGPRPHLQQMNDDDYAQWTDQLLGEFGKTPLRIFAYGSLIWKPEFEYVKAERATLKGWHRSFCMKIERWRGTRAVPGLMMALDRGGSCSGMIYELGSINRNQQIEKLLRREMTNKPPTNMPRVLTVSPGTESISVIAFTASRTGHSYVGKIALPEVASILARAAGQWGTGVEYLFNTVSHLEQLNIQDKNLWELQKLVAAEIEKF